MSKMAQHFVDEFCNGCRVFNKFFYCEDDIEILMLFIFISSINLIPTNEVVTNVIDLVGFGF